MKQLNCKKLNITTDKKLKVKAVALGIPGKDVSLSVYKGVLLSQREVKAEEKRYKKIIIEWKEQAESLDQRHLIITTSVPENYRDLAEHSMVLGFDISVLLNDDVKAKHNPWPEDFVSDLGELMELMR